MSLYLGRGVYLLFELGDFQFHLRQSIPLVLILAQDELLAEEFECQVFIPHVALVNLLLDHDLLLEFDVHLYLHSLQLIL